MNHWDKYWSDGHITSFGLDFRENYEGEYASFWGGIYNNLTSDSKVLDLATGNLALPILALKAVGERDHHYAVDLSAISKENIIKKMPWAEQFINKVKLYDKTSIEKLPFEDDYFDLITSMYGVEYANTDRAFGEIFRVLKADGQFIAICHHTDSTLIQKNQRSHQFLNDVLHKNKVFEALATLSATIGNETSEYALRELRNNKKAEKLRKKLNELMALYEAEYQAELWDSGIPQFVHHFFSSLRDSRAKQRSLWLGKMQKDLQLYSSRLSDLLNACLDEKKLEKIEALAKSKGFEKIHREPFIKGNEIVGLKLQIQK